jgi:very-short-patch-repair endonuclease
MTYLYNNKLLEPLRRRLRTESTDAERCIWRRLRMKQVCGLRFLRQFGIGNYIVDFYCPEIRLVIELDGSQHLENREADTVRTEFLNSQNIIVIRFWDNDALKETDAVIQSIYDTAFRLLNNTQPLLPPPIPDVLTP